MRKALKINSSLPSQFKWSSDSKDSFTSVCTKFKATEMTEVLKCEHAGDINVIDIFRN